MKETDSPIQLTRAIRLHHATAMVVGTIIGASIFVQASEITGKVPSWTGAALVWMVAGILTWFGALVTAELASTIPKSGGVYVYLREAFSPAVGFLWGWAMFWTMHSGIIAAVAVVFARYLGSFIGLEPGATKGVAVGVIFLLSAVNCLGVKQGSNLQLMFTLGKIVVIILIIALGLVLGPTGTGESEMLDPSPEAASGGLLGGGTFQDFLLALVAALFAFGGWHMVTYNAEETVNPRTTIPRALTVGILVVTVCYVALNCVYFHLLPLETVVNSKRVAADAADAMFGSGGAKWMSALVVFSTFGALSGIILAGPRVYFAMSRDGLLFKWIGVVHPRRRIPHRSIILQATWSSVLVLTGTYRALFTRVIYTEWIFFGLMAVGIFVLRRRGMRRDYSVWGFPWVPAVFILAALTIVVNQVLSDPGESLVGLSLVLAGVPVYYIWVRKNPARSETPEEGST